MLTTCYFAFQKCKLSSSPPPIQYIKVTDIAKVLQMIFNIPLTNDTFVLFKVHSFITSHTYLNITFQNSLQSPFRIATSCLNISCLVLILSKSSPIQKRSPFFFYLQKSQEADRPGWCDICPPPPKKNKTLLGNALTITVSKLTQ